MQFFIVNSFLLIGFCSCVKLHRKNSYKLKVGLRIDTNNVIQTTNPLSPSVAAGLGLFEQHWVDYFRDPKFLVLTKGLGPSFFRVGGTKADVTYFQPDTLSRKHRTGHPYNTCKPVPRTNKFSLHKIWAEKEVEKFKLIKLTKGLKKALHPIPMTESDWVKLNEFCNCVGWKLVFGLNLLQRDGQEWNSTNAQTLMTFTKNKDFKVNWELGNEPNSYHNKMNITLTPEQVGEGFKQLRSLLSKSSWWNNSLLIGPDINRISASSAMNFMNRFLDNAGSTIDAMTFHQYYLNGRTATIADFKNPKTLNLLIKQIKLVAKNVNKHTPGKKLWLGETASAYGGGAIGLSNSYIDGFTWLDKLGVTSRMGIDLVIRQSLLQSYYSLIDNNFDPLPDYWLTLLYKRLVGHRVLKVTLTNLSKNSTMKNKLVRIYAHCTNIQRSNYKPGSVVIYFINLKSKNVKLTLNPVNNETLRGDLYLLEPGIPGNLTSQVTNLNGVPLHLTSIPSLPPLQPARLHPKALTKGLYIPPFTYGFLVLYNAKASACLEK